MGDDDSTGNPFVRFKRHVDRHIGATWNGVFNLSTTPSENTASPAPESSPLPPDQHQVGKSSPPMRLDTPAEGSKDLTQPGAPSPSPSPSRTIEWRPLSWRQAQLWQYFADYSPYSPLNLRSLPQPVPQDVPEGVDPESFTYEDAFEDLLAAASGQSMLDLRRRAEMRGLLRHMFPGGEPSSFWLQRLQSQGLLQASKYVSNRLEDWDRWGWHRPLSMEEWVDRRRRQIEGGAWGAAEEQAPPERRSLSSQRGDWSDWSDWWDRDFVFNPGEFMRRADRAFKALGKAVEDIAQTDFSSSEKRAEEPAPQKDAAETEGDLFSSITSALADADRSFSSFVRNVFDGSVKSEVSSAFTKSESFLEDGKDAREDPSKTVRSDEEHVDAFGNLHTKTEVRRMNAEGQEIGREVHYSVRPAPSAQKRGEGTGDRDEGTAVGQGDDAEKPSGWFWK